jgi:uncharacterized membrane protein
LMSGLAVLKQRPPAAALWSRVGGDVVDLALLTGALLTPGTGKLRGALATASVGAITALDVGLGRAATKAAEPLEVQSWITIAGSPEALYGRWREPRTVPEVMQHFAEVRLEGDLRSHWVVSGPAGTRLEWDSEIVEERPGERLAWQSRTGSSPGPQGSVTFRPAPSGLGTEVGLSFRLESTAGTVGAAMSPLSNRLSRLVLGKALRRFKSLVETGEIPTLERNPAARPSSR